MTAQTLSFMPSSHPEIPAQKIGVLIVNLGSPQEPTYSSLRAYLKEFLSDPRVIEAPKFLWFFVLRLFILPFRPRKILPTYKEIWNEDKKEFLLKTITREQASLLQKKFDHNKIIIDWSMRYGQPSIDQKLKYLKQQGCQRILFFPLYPQYCAATTASVLDSCMTSLQSLRWMPTFRTVPPYHDHPLYIKALSSSLQEGLKNLNFTPDKILCSYHGIPKIYFDKGDPYYCFCSKTTRLLKESCPEWADKIELVFQSRFGREEWLKPYLTERILDYAQSGLVNDIVLFSPGFAADCLETKVELAIETKELFLEKGGENLAYIDALNTRDDHILMLETIIRTELQGWV
jgi:protoporphyrin/coproporphyrin ferrochelatase